MSSFKAYIDVEEYDSEYNSNHDNIDGFDARSEIALLPGETIVSSAKNVLKFTALSEQRQGITGVLFVTNFKISFVTADRSSFELVDKSMRNKILNECDICLVNVDSVYCIIESNNRKKKLPLGTSINTNVQNIQIHCKDFRVHTFSFKFTPRGEEKAIINAILHHSFPSRPQLLFAFDYKGPVSNGYNASGTPLFAVAADWFHELKRLGCDHNWRVSHVNESFMMSRSLPQTFVVPSKLLDDQIQKAAPHFHENRIPVWCWSLPDGCAIVRSSGIHPGISDSKKMSMMLNFIRSTHPRGKQPRFIDLDTFPPNVKDIQQCYLKLRDICVSDTTNQFWEQDTRYLSHLENTKWLSNVAACLDISKQLASCCYQYQLIIVLQEQEGRDLSCLISSLMQIFLDSHYRTITGFQSLIQKEWISMGHPFRDRLRHIRGADNEECPLFLLFLDCVWQILQQFPSEFEFTEIYLTTLWDCTRLTTFDTFLFNCAHDLWSAKKDLNNPLQPRSLWDWKYLFHREERSLFHNPLYLVDFNPSRTTFSPSRETSSLRIYDRENSLLRGKSEEAIFDLFANSHETSFQQSNPSTPVISRASSQIYLDKWKFMYKVLPLNTRLSALKFWDLCYLRWNPLAQIFGGGPSVAYMERCQLVRDIFNTQKKLASIVGAQEAMPTKSEQDAINLLPSNSLKLLDMTSAFPYSPGGTPSTFGLPVTLHRQNSFISSDDELED